MEGLRLAEAAASSPTAQLSAGSQQLSLRSAPQALALLARTHGWSSLYAGLSINYMKVGQHAQAGGPARPPAAYLNMLLVFRRPPLQQAFDGA